MYIYALSRTCVCSLHIDKIDIQHNAIYYNYYYYYYIIFTQEIPMNFTTPAACPGTILSGTVNVRSDSQIVTTTNDLRAEIAGSYNAHVNTHTHIRGATLGHNLSHTPTQT